MEITDKAQPPGIRVSLQKPGSAQGPPDPCLIAGYPKKGKWPSREQARPLGSGNRDASALRFTSFQPERCII